MRNWLVAFIVAFTVYIILSYLAFTSVEWALWDAKKDIDKINKQMEELNSLTK